MKNQLMKTLFSGVIALTSMFIFVSCNYASDDDMDELKNRVTVIEGLIPEIQTAIEKAQVTGATVTSATCDDNGVWTLTLSDGKVIKITPTTSGSSSGSTISVVKNSNNIIITIDGKDYVLPLSPAVVSLIYSPQYADGMELIGADGNANVKFLVSPVITANDIANATYDICEAHELATRAGSSMFKLNGDVTYADGFITVPIRALNVKSGRSYAISIQMTLNGTTIISNYFTVKMDASYNFVAEDLVNPTFASFITDAKQIDGGYWTATLPSANADFLSTFKFSDVITNVPAGAVFEIGDYDLQNDNAKGRFDFFKSCLSNNGTWNMTSRPGTNCSGDETKPGLLVVVKLNDVVKMKIYWKVVDPLANVKWIKVDKMDGSTQSHPEWNTWGAKQGKFDMQTELWNYDADNNKESVVTFRAAMAKYEISSKSEGDVIYTEDGHFKLGDLGKSAAKFSKGIYFQNAQTSVVDANTHEVKDGFDGISDEMMEQYGVKITEDGYIEFTSKYTGTPFRIGPRVKYQWAYGDVEIAERFAWFWFNRR